MRMNGTERGGKTETRRLKMRRPAGGGSLASASSRPRTLKSVARRSAILDAALDEFSARGFAAARLDDVAKRAGVAKGTIYLHFADKESLFQELIRFKMGPVVGTLESVFAADLPIRVIAVRPSRSSSAKSTARIASRYSA